MYPSLQLTVSAVSSSPILWDAVNKANITDKKMGTSRSPRVSLHATSFPHTYRTRGQLDVAIYVQLKIVRQSTYVACVGEKPKSTRLTLWCPSDTRNLPCSGSWRKREKSVSKLMPHQMRLLFNPFTYIIFTDSGNTCEASNGTAIR